MFTGVENCARTPPMLLPVEPFPCELSRSINQHVFAAGMREMPGDAGTDNAAANDDYLCRLHATCALMPPIAGRAPVPAPAFSLPPELPGW